MDFNEQVEKAKKYLLMVIREVAPLPYSERGERLFDLVGDAYVSHGISLRIAKEAMGRIEWKRLGFQAESFWGDFYKELTIELVDDILSHIESSEFVTMLDDPEEELH